MSIVPDTKNWTWVTERPCPQCGFDASAFAPTEVAGLLRANVAAWPAVLERPDVRRRPDASTWSPLEYAAHVRDVFRMFSGRLSLMLAEDDPEFENWDQDATAIADRYDEQDPETVSAELVDAGGRFTEAVDELGPGPVDEEPWTRSGRRSDGSVFTVASLLVYASHDPLHHLWDVSGERFAPPGAR